MVEATFTFPRGFIWGTATAAHQVEGNNTNNNWFKWEQEGHIIDGHTCGLACDWWGGRWKEDFDRAAETGQNAHRLSVEWSRIQPAPNRWDEDALDHYREMARGLKERGLTPMVTLHHFTDPLWLAERGGWENPEVVDYFEKFVRRVVDALKEYVYLWVTINEPNVLIANGYILSVFPPGKKDIRAAYRVLVNIINAHAAAYRTLHQFQKNALVGLAHHFLGFTPAKSSSPLDRWIAGFFFKAFNQAIPQALSTGVIRFSGARKRIPSAKGNQDFFGINYYTREYVAFKPFAPASLFSKRFYDPKIETSPTGFFANEPGEFFRGLKWATQFGLPIYVTENGTEDPEDSFRRRYLAQHIRALWRGVNYTWPIRGYFHWSLVDNFEWERGWTQRFGLWELDNETQARRKRKSAALYEAICKENALSSSMVTEFVPELFESMFPG
jgi:beta-glucosidase